MDYDEKPLSVSSHVGVVTEELERGLPQPPDSPTGTVPSLISLEVVVAVGIRLIRPALVEVDSSGSNPRGF